MHMRTSILLHPSQERAVLKLAAQSDCSKADAIRYFVEKGIEAERIRRLLELMTLRTFFYLRQIAHERGTDVQQLEVDFAEAGPDMLEALYNGVGHVGK